MLKDIAFYHLPDRYGTILMDTATKKEIDVVKSA